MTGLVKGVANIVVNNGGIVRGVQNHGLRDLPHRFKARNPDAEGVRYFKRGRFLSVYYDSSPQTMRDVTDAVNLQSDFVLRQTHLKVRNKIWDVNIVNEKKNPYIQRVLQMEKEQGEKQQA